MNVALESTARAGTAVGDGDDAPSPVRSTPAGPAQPPGQGRSVPGVAAVPDVTAISGELLDYGADLAAALIAVIKRIGALRSRLPSTADYDVSQTHLLIRLVELGTARASELTEQVCADASTVSRQVAALVRAGLIERRADPDDGRASLLVPTAAGLAQIAWHRRMRGSVLGPLIAGWTDDERTSFLRLLTDLTRGLDIHRDAIVTALRAAHPDRSS